MQKKQITIENEVMEKIHNHHIQMRPKIYYVFGSILVFLSLAFSIVSSIFLISLTRFALKTHGPMGQFRLEQLLSSFPWWAPILAIVSLIIGIWLLKKYDISYKKNFLLLCIMIVFAVLLAGWVIDYTGLDNVWFRQGPMRGIMRQYLQENGTQPGRGMNMRRFMTP
jgi:hypothetical protein